ncbi:hypothetical protein EJ03DRAFT_31960 [Teratosphaeria nubilosa]|uniref:Peptidase S54 rhomboid domain-containing protein n=1 Tax=Teratosphaeria nubilosa TaxID=161662 RepID=A0A6G1KUU7_9PEZI|nr:hypothetical protein EJ03DRAFT_31960 [Teratosphaeria nubilosa]
MDTITPGQHLAFQAFVCPWRLTHGTTTRFNDKPIVSITNINFREHVKNAVAAITGVNVFVWQAEAVHANQAVKKQQYWSASGFAANQARAKAQLGFRRTLALTEKSWQSKNWYTWITSSFVHKDFQHLASNVVSMIFAGIQCMRQILGCIRG